MSDQIPTAWPAHLQVTAGLVSEAWSATTWTPLRPEAFQKRYAVLFRTLTEAH